MNRRCSILKITKRFSSKVRVCYNKRLAREIIKYFIVSLVAAVADTFSFVFLYEYCEIHYLLSNTIAFILGLSLNYILSVKFVFIGEARKTTSEFFVFAIIGVVGLLISHMTLFLSIDIIGLNSLISKLFSLGATFFWNFFVRKILLFNKETSNKEL